MTVFGTSRFNRLRDKSSSSSISTNEERDADPVIRNRNLPKRTKAEPVRAVVGQNGGVTNNTNSPNFRSIGDTSPLDSPEAAARYCELGRECFHNKKFELANKHFMNALRLTLPRYTDDEANLDAVEMKYEATKILLRIHEIYLKLRKRDRSKKTLQSAEMLMRQVLSSKVLNTKRLSGWENNTTEQKRVYLLQQSSFSILSKIMWKISYGHAEEGDISTAEANCREAITCNRNSINILKFRGIFDSKIDIGKRKLELAKQLVFLADILKRRGSFKEAATSYSEALTMRQAAQQDGDHEEVLTIMDALSQAYQGNEEYAAAIQCVDVLLQYYRKPSNGTNGRLFRMILRQSQLHVQKEDFDTGMKFAMEALEISKVRKENENIHPLQKAEAMEQIANVFEKKVRLDEAIAWQNKAFLARTSILAESDELVAKSTSAIAKIYCKQGEFDKAKALLKGNRDKLVQMYGVNHRIVASIFENLGDVYMEQKIFTMALKCYLRTLEIRKTYAHEEQQTSDAAVAMKKIGIVLLKKGRRGEAMTYFSQTLDALRRCHFCRSHPLVVETIHDMAAFEHDEDELESTSVFL